MKNFNQFAEAVLITTAKPESDSAGEITGHECPCQQAQPPMDMFSQSAEDVLNNIGDVVQPDDDVGETGEIESDSEEGSGVEIECTESGMWVKFGDFEMIIPKHVAEAIKEYVASEHGDETESEEEHEEHEAEESEEHEEKEEHAFGETEEDEEAEEHEAGETEEEEEEEEKVKEESAKLDLAKDVEQSEEIKKKKCKKCMRKKTQPSN